MEKLKEEPKTPEWFREWIEWAKSVDLDLRKGKGKGKGTKSSDEEMKKEKGS